MKKAIIGLWISSFSLILILIVVAQFRPFSSTESGITYFIFSTLILTAMFLQTLKNKYVARISPGAKIDENIKKQMNYNLFISKVIFIAVAFIYNVYHLILRLL